MRNDPGYQESEEIGKQGEEVTIMIKRYTPLAILASLLVALAFVPSAMAAFGLQQLAIAATNENGLPDVQAGSHPYAFTTTFILNDPPAVEVELEPGVKETLYIPEGDIKDVRAELPPGFVGNPDATPRCSYQTFTDATYGVNCPNETVVGVSTTYWSDFESDVVEFDFSDPVYNLEPPRGVAAEFGFKVAGKVPVFLDVSVRTGGDYGLTVRSSNLSQAAEVLANKVTIWGVPADPRHSGVRGTCLKPFPNSRGLGEGEDERETAESNGGECPVNTPQVPLLTNPTSCGVPRTATLSVDSWEEPGGLRVEDGVAAGARGLRKTGFQPDDQRDAGRDGG